jgi:hypothetical protein
LGQSNKNNETILICKKSENIKNAKFLSKNQKVQDHFADLGIDVKIILLTADVKYIILIQVAQ